MRYYIKFLGAIAVQLLVVVANVYSVEDYMQLEDTTSTNYNLSEIEILSNPKSVIPLVNFPGSVSIIGAEQIERENIVTIKDISTLAPNLFIPDYGSKLISAIYIRGIGSRINSPAVGLYVDNIPYQDKSSFDFELVDISKIEVLRGPQGTLYGHNTMGGLINIYTVSPFQQQGTKIKLGIGNYNSKNVSVINRGKFNDKLAYSVSASYRANDGYFINEYTDKPSGSEDNVGGSVNLQYRATDALSFSLISRYEYSNQDGYPYKQYDKYTKTEYPISYGDECSYKRNTSTTGFNVKYVNDNFELNSVTSYQFLRDDMRLDQDFTTVRDFTLQQKQNENTISQEVALRSTKQRRGWDWSAGASGYYSKLDVIGPVTFYDDGLQYMIEDTFNDMVALYAGTGSMPSINLTIDKDDPLVIEGVYKTPSFGVGAFAQGTYNINRFSFTAGLRLEYEEIRIEHTTGAGTSMTGVLDIDLFDMPLSMSVPLEVSGSDATTTLQLLPRFEVKYKLSRDVFAYATFSKGYRSGGYNYQAFSNVIRQKMINGIVSPFLDMMPDYIAELFADSDVNSMISYKPEYSWNYEIGSHHRYYDGRLSADLALFFIDCRDQQISVVEGLGRITKNAGQTHSRGVEVALRGEPIENLLLSTSYGYTNAIFKEYYDGETSYVGNNVPFSPKHTLAVNATYILKLSDSWLDAITFNVGTSAQGRIYWTEANDVYQNFYALLNSDIAFTKGMVKLSLWGKNLNNANYQTFYFETINATDVMSESGFREQGRPITFGVDIEVAF